VAHEEIARAAGQAAILFGVNETPDQWPQELTPYLKPEPIAEAAGLQEGGHRIAPEATNRIGGFVRGDDIGLTKTWCTITSKRSCRLMVGLASMFQKLRR
jgi:hypothetical protein